MIIPVDWKYSYAHSPLLFLRKSPEAKTEGNPVHQDHFPYADAFNRNLSLHKLSGVNDPREGKRNLTRLLLVLDILAERHLILTSKEYWHLAFYATSESNLDFQIRFELYKK